MGEGRSRIMVALGVLVCLWLGYVVAQKIAGPADDPQDGAVEGEFDALATLQEELLDELQEGARRGRMPGLEARSQGFGMLTGVVRLHCDGEPRPMPDIDVRLIGHDGQRALSEPGVLTDTDGVFTFEHVPAHVGYVLIVDQAPYRRVVLRGNEVLPDKTTDVGVILLGAPTTLQGEVRDAKGRPIAGAEVRVMRDKSGPHSVDAARAIYEIQSAMNFLAESEVGADGRFSIEALSPGRYVLRISAPGFATTFKSNVLVTVDERSSSVRVILDAGVGFEGRVLDESGRGVANARIIAMTVPGLSSQKRVDRFEVRSGADGSYRLDTLVSGMTYAIDTWAEGYAPVAALITTGSGVEPRNFELQASGRIEGRLVDEATGEGIPDANVSALVGSLGRFSPVSATTDRAGDFVMAHVVPGPVFMFSAKADGYQPSPMFDFKSVRNLHVQGGETTWIDWSLVAGGRLVGQVTAGGRPVPYAALTLVDRERGRQQWTGAITGMTDVEGGYQLPGVQAGQYDLQVHATGFAPYSDPAESLVVMPTSLGEVRKNVVLARGATLRGTVTGPAGEVLRGALVQLRSEKGAADDGNLRDLVALTSGSGTYVITGVPGGMEVIVSASHDAWVSSVDRRVRVSPGQEQRVDLKLRAGVALQGRVRDARGAGIGDARVRWGSVNDVPEGDLRNSLRADSYLTSRVIRTDSDGAFELVGLAPGRMLLKVEKDGFASWYQRDLQIPGDGTAAAALTIELVSTQTIRGTVRGGDSKRGLAGAFVAAEERGPTEGSEEPAGRVHAILSVETDENGRYVLENVPPGLFRVTVWFGPPGYAGEVQGGDRQIVRKDDVAAGARGVDFELAPLRAPEIPDGD